MSYFLELSGKASLRKWYLNGGQDDTRASLQRAGEDEMLRDLTEGQTVELGGEGGYCYLCFAFEKSL